MIKKILNRTFKDISNILSRFIDDILLSSGIVLLAIGVFLMYIPAGFITLGICLMAFAFFIAKRGG